MNSVLRELGNNFLEKHRPSFDPCTRPLLREEAAVSFGENPSSPLFVRPVATKKLRTMPLLPTMQAVLDLLPDAVFCVDTHALTLCQVNRAACVCLGYTLEELQGMELGNNLSSAGCRGPDQTVRPGTRR